MLGCSEQDALVRAVPLVIPMTRTSLRASDRKLPCYVDGIARLYLRAHVYHSGDCVQASLA
jgi:hypothetical protein